MANSTIKFDSEMTPVQALNLLDNFLISVNSLGGAAGKVSAGKLRDFIGLTSSSGLVQPVNPGGTLPNPSTNAWTILGEGSYNNGNLVVSKGNIGLAYYNGSTWQVTEMKLPQSDADLLSLWSFVPIDQTTKVTVVNSTIGNTGFLKIDGTIMVFNASGGYYTLNSVQINFTSGNDILYLSEDKDEYKPLNPYGNTQVISGKECFIRTMPAESFRDAAIVPIGMSFAGYYFNSIYNIFKPQDIDLDYVIKTNGPTDLYVKKNDLKDGIDIIISSRIPVFSNKTNRFFWINPGTVRVPNASVLVLSRNGVLGKTYSFNTELPEQSEVSLEAIPLPSYNPKLMNAPIAFIWGNSVNSSSEYLMSANSFVSSEDFDVSSFVDVRAIKNDLRDFFNKVQNLTDDDFPLEINAIGDSISNFQNTGPDEWKTDKTVEPQGLYGNTWLRWLWRKMNYTFNGNGQDSASGVFSHTNPKEWGNLRFLRVDNSSVIKTGDYIPSGTRASDGNFIYWGQRQNINGAAQCLGGYRNSDVDRDVIATPIGDVRTHNHIYFFFEENDQYVEFTIPANAKGFSFVYWADDHYAPFPMINGGEWKYLSTNCEVTVDSVVVDNINQTLDRGLTRKNYKFSENREHKVRITNKDNTGRIMNLWGLEYWLGKCVRLTNSALAGNRASAFYNNPNYFINKPADLIVWQTTTLNDIGGYINIGEHKKLGQLLKNRNSNLFVTTCHPPVEANPTSTNYVERATAIKLFQHPDDWAAIEALFELGINHVDTFEAFCKIGAEYGYTGYYNELFIDYAHLSVKGNKIYQNILGKVFTYS